MNEYHEQCKATPLTQTRGCCVYSWNPVLISGDLRFAYGFINAIFNGMNPRYSDIYWYDITAVELYYINTTR